MLSENPSVFLADFGQVVTSGIYSGLGIFDAPDQIDGLTLSTDYSVTIRASDFPNLGYGSSLSTGGKNFTVREVRAIDNGTFAVATLSKS
jgi:hypothetical protein